MAKKRKKITEESKKAEKERIKKIKIRVVGIGGGGGSIVAEIAQKVKRASFFVADTDFKALGGLSRKVERLQFGQSLTQGLGTGMNPEIGKIAAKNEREKIKKLLEGQDLVILIACLGGGIGSGASPIFAKISKNLGNLTYGIFTLPFKFEGEKKMEIAKNSLKELKGKLNAFSVIPNERIFQIVDRATPLKKALSSINKSLADGLLSLIEIIYRPGLINIDFADLKTVFEGRGYLAYLNSIEIDGEEGEKEAMERVINFPLYPYSIEGAKGVLLNISGQKNLSLTKVSQISKTISEKCHKEAKIIFGVSQARQSFSKKNLGGQAKKDSMIKITILATGCSKPRSEISLLRGKKNFSERTKKKLKPESSKMKKIEIVKVEKKNKPDKTKIILLAKQKKKIELSKKEGRQQKEESEAIIRKNALQIKKEAEAEEADMLAKEKFWETPAFLRKKLKPY